jgi:hypothetical protein
VAPTLPANSLLLATIAVGAGVSSIVAGNITDGRVYTVARSAALCRWLTSPAASAARRGCMGRDLSTGRLKVADGAGNARQPKVAAFAPGHSHRDATVTSTSSLQVLNSVSVTVDGVTELEVTTTWRSIDLGTGSPAVNDSVDLVFSTTNGAGGASWSGSYGNTCYQFCRGAGTGQSSGGTFRSWITPSAGTVTIYLLGQLGQSTTYTFKALNLRVQANVHS